MKLAELMQELRISRRVETDAMFRQFPPEVDVIPKVYQDGELIFREGDPISFVGILLQGRYACVWDVSGRDDYVHISLKPPVMMGDQAAMAGLSCYTGSFRAAGQCRVALVRLPDFWLWMDRDPEVYRETASKHIRKLLEQCQARRSTVVQQSDIRITKYLVWYCQVKGGASKEGLPSPLIVRATREAMTESIGRISLRTVNRILSQMEQEGKLSIVRGKVRISPAQYQAMLDTLESYIGGA